jgi:N-acetyl-gamma-glutamyl-phosphate reductase
MYAKGCIVLRMHDVSPSVTTMTAASSPDAAGATTGTGASDRRFRVAVVGASGYAGGETLRVLSGHPAVEVTTVTAHSSVGKHLSEVAPHVDLGEDLELVETTTENLTGHDVVVLALPHGQSGRISAELREADPEVLVLDLGADHRLESAQDWQDYYHSEHSGTWTYGMPELPLAGPGATRQRELLRSAREIAVPGCNATAVSLAAVPLVRAGLVDPSALNAVLPVGYSGAGKSAKPHLLASEALGGANPYGVGGSHRHIPEILQNIRRSSGIDARLTFTPVLVPMARGILAVLTAPAGDGVTEEDLLGSLTADYGQEHFAQVLPSGVFPRTQDVLGANTVRIGATIDRRSGQVTVISAIDNLVKGTAGAAVQSMNVALGLPETTGLTRTALAP